MNTGNLFTAVPKHLVQIRRIGFTIKDHTVTTGENGATYTSILAERGDGSVRTYYGVTESSRMRVFQIATGQILRVQRPALPPGV